jgi:hypothetical protein
MRISYILIFVLLCSCLSAQEIVTGLQFNPVVRAQYLKNNMLKSGKSADSIPITLPFYDDFSSNEVFPSSLRWIDRYAYQNSDYPLYPIDRGVVTMDAINDSGSMYPEAVGGPQSFIADHLTSRYIRLDSVFSPTPRKLTPSDSVYLSFYYQPQGVALAPHTSDSLVLQFLVKPKHDSIAVGDTTIYVIPDKWRHIWSDKGMQVDSFNYYNHTYFKRVLIRIADTVFFKEKFQFQFYNYVSLADLIQPSWQSNCCQWNIDLVYLNTGRNLFDTVRKAIRFVDRPPSLLKSYQSMPYPQFCNNPSNEMIDSLSVNIANRDTITHSSKYAYFVIQPGTGFSKNYETPAFNFLSYTQYKNFYKTVYPPVPFTFPISSSDSTVFDVIHIVHDVTPGSTLADTMIGYQKFYNYYAYDDGTAEAGYGLKGTGGMMAYRFKLNKSPDTLRAIQIYFNHTLDTANIQLFYLTVWDDNSGIPGDTIYSRQVLTRYPDSINKFTTYLLENPVKISGAFYVGTIQTTDDNLNIGLDLYIPDNSVPDLFYNVSGSWIGSSITKSALMVRPLIGKPLPVGIATLKSNKGNITVFPNPCNTGLIHITTRGQESTQSSDHMILTISTMTGQQVYQSGRTDVADVSLLPAGIYIIEVRNTSTFQHFVSKLVILK